jgi:hypothetical protein
LQAFQKLRHAAPFLQVVQEDGQLYGVGVRRASGGGAARAAMM